MLGITRPLTCLQTYFLRGLQGLTVSFTVVAGRRLSVPLGRNRPFLASRTRVPASFLAIIYLTLLEIKWCIAYHAMRYALLKQICEMRF